MAVSNQAKGPIIMTAPLDAVTDRVYISWIRWVGATTAGHALSVTDTAGDVIAASEADGANFLDMIPVFQLRDGVKAAALQSGTLYVYFK